MPRADLRPLSGGTMPVPPSRPGERVRVAFCCDSLIIGGTELNAVRTAERLDRSRYDVSVIAFRDRGPLGRRYAAAGIPVSIFSMSSLYGPAAMMQTLRLARHLARERIDVVHSHDVYTNILATVAARIARTPAVIASRRWWTVVPRPVLLTANRWAYRLADCVLANSPSVAALVRDADRVPADRVTVISNYVDDGAFCPLPADARASLLRELGVPDGSPVLGVIANLHAGKDQASLVRALALLGASRPDAHVVLVGDGECRGPLETLAERLGVRPRVHFAGMRPHEPNLHRLFDISLLVSLDEAFPNSVIEAMAAARPVIATAVGGVPDAVRDGETGVLVPPANPERLAAAIDGLLGDADRRRAMGEAGQRRARECYHASRVIPQLEGLYERLLDATPRRPSWWTAPSGRSGQQRPDRYGVPGASGHSRPAAGAV